MSLLRFLTRPFRRRSAKRRQRVRRKLKLTREGKYYVAITIGIGLAAINTGNNLLYLLLGWMLSTIVASGVMSNLCLRGLRIARIAPKRVFANQPFLMELEAFNEKKRYASYSLEVEDVCEGQPVDKRCYFLKIPEGRSQHTAYRHTVSRRGVYHFDAFRVATKFPFGLFNKSVKLSTETELLVFPEIRPVQLPPPRGQRMGEHQSNQVGRRGEFFGLREYREGDDRNSIHWRSSARQDKLLVREYEDESQQRITLLIDNALPDARDAEQEQALEDAISLCASLAQAYLERGYALWFIARGVQVPFAMGQMQIQRVLKALALLETVDDSVPFAARIPPRADSLLIAPRGISAKQRPGHVGRVMEAH